MDEQKSSQTLAISIGLLNLSGFGLGYLYMEKWIRWGIHLLISVILVAVGMLTNLSRSAFILIPVFILWMLWMAYDGWRQGRELKPEKGLFPIHLSKTQSWILIVVPLLILCLEGLGFAGYCRLGQKEFQQGMLAYQNADCEAAASHFRKVSTLYEFTFSPNRAEADQRIVECELLLSADEAYQEGAYEDAIALYQEYRNTYSDGNLTQYAQERLADVYFAWGGDLKDKKAIQKSIEKYTKILDDYPDSSAAARTPAQIGESYLLLSDQLWESGEYQAAIEKARIPLSDYPSTPSGKNAAGQIAEIYYDWAADMQSKGHYQNAANKVHIILEMYPETEIKDEAAAFIAEIYKQWAANLFEEGEYRDCISKYETLLTEYPDLVSEESIREDIKSAYLAWAGEYREQSSYQRAITKYETLHEEYPQTISAEEKDQLIVRTQLEWGDELYQKDKFKAAIVKFDEVVEDAEDPDLHEAAEEGYEKALWGLSQDQGLEGEQVMEETLTEVCNGNSASSPAVGLAEDEPGKGLACESMYDLPTDLQADYPGHFQYVVSRREGAKTVQTCNYTAGHTLYRKQLTWTIIVRETVTGDFFSKTFYGSMPPKCYQTETFYGKTKSKFGSDPSAEEVNDWLELVIE